MEEFLNIKLEDVAGEPSIGLSTLGLLTVLVMEQRYLLTLTAWTGLERAWKGPGKGLRTPLAPWDNIKYPVST